MARKQNKRRDFGSVRKLPSGRYQARFTLDGKQHKAPDTFEEEWEAWDYLNQIKPRARAGLWKSEEQKQHDATTVKEFLGAWFERKSRDFKPSTTNGYSKRLNTRVYPYPISKLKVSEVTRADTLRWYNSLPDTPATNQKTYRMLRQAFESVVGDGVHGVEANPIYVDSSLRKEKRVMDKYTPETEEMLAVYDKLDDRYKALGMLTLLHGLRLGEALAIDKVDVTVEPDPDPDPSRDPGPWPRIVKVHVHDNGQYLPDENGKYRMVKMGSTKTGNKRRVPILSRFHTDLFRHMNTYPGPLLSPSPTGEMTAPATFRDALKRAQGGAGLGDKRIHPHAGRRFLTTELLEQGVEPNVVGAIIGDKDLSTVMNTYSDVREKRMTEAMRDLEF